MHNPNSTKPLTGPAPNPSVQVVREANSKRQNPNRRSNYKIVKKQDLMARARRGIAKKNVKGRNKKKGKNPRLIQISSQGSNKV